MRAEEMRAEGKKLPAACAAGLCGLQVAVDDLLIKHALDRGVISDDTGYRVVNLPHTQCEVLAPELQELGCDTYIPSHGGMYFEVKCTQCAHREDCEK